VDYNWRNWKKNQEREMEKKEKAIEYWESFLDSYLGQNYGPQNMVRFLNVFGNELAGLNEEYSIMALQYAQAALSVISEKIGEILDEYENE